jgi:hemerythrin
MAVVTWEEQFSINVGKIDEQHQQLLQLVNDLHTSVEESMNMETVKAHLSALLEFARYHFEAEEELMKRHSFPNINVHRHEHLKLLTVLERLSVEVSNGKKPFFYPDADLSSDWALNHIDEHDKALGEFLNSKQVY